MDVLSRSFVSSIVLVGGLVGCRTTTPRAPAPGPEAPDFSVKLCREPRHPDGTVDCPTGDCPPNSPVVNGFPINGFSKESAGVCNAAGVQLIPHSLRGGHCGDGAELGLDPSGTRLVGTRQGQVVCAGEELTGASFLVRSYARDTQSFAITNVRQIAMLDHVHQYEGYRIETDGASACEPATALRVRRQLGLVPENQAPPAPLPRPVGYQFGPHDDLVIAVDGPLYDREDRVVPGSRDHWFNLACAGDALAKRTLYNLYSASDDARNETALRMLTANYCGRPYTVPGIELAWATTPEDGKTAQHQEALWQGGQAICLDTPRLMTLHVTEGGKPISPADFPPQLQPGACRARRCDAAQWTEALHAECRLPACDDLRRSARPFEFDSYAPGGDQNRIILATH
jgi:hypothetical protein